MAVEKILATPRSFGKADRSPIALLEEAGMDAWYYPLPGAGPAVRFTWRADQPELGAFLARHITFHSVG